MNEKFKKSWVVALRSGKYKQIQHLLERRTIKNEVIGNCCLGVACHVYEEMTHKILEKCCKPLLTTKEMSVSFKDKFYETTVSLPKSVSKYAGIAYNDIMILTEMNDRRGKSFDELADYIEKL